MKPRLKKLTIFLPFLATNTLARIFEIRSSYQKALQEINKEKQSQNQDNEHHDLGLEFDPFKNFDESDFLRAFSGPMTAAIERLDGYGCWCYLREDYIRGKGKPRNEIDQLCKTMALGYDCAIIDGRASGKKKDLCEEPWAVPYDAAVGGHSFNNIFEACQHLNPSNTCQQMACAIEGHFVSELIATLIDLGGNVDNTYYHNANHNGIPGEGEKTGWNPHEPGHCAWERVPDKTDDDQEEEDEENNLGGGGNGNGGGNGGGNGHLDDDLDNISGTEGPATTAAYTGPTDVQCCGDWPKRHPYHTRNGMKQCCGQRTFDATFLECCEDDHLRTVCSD